MLNERTRNWALYVVVLSLILGALGWDTLATAIENENWRGVKLIGRFLFFGLATGSLYALGGIGIVVLFRATGVLNFANGAAGAAGVMFAWQLGQWGVWPPLTWLACIVLATAILLFYGRLIAPALSYREPVVKAVATLGFALVILGLVSFIWIDDPRSISLPTDKIAMKILGVRVTATRLMVLGLSIFVVVAIFFFLRFTVVGLQMRALANDRDLAALIGIPILRVETIAWAIAGVVAGITGLIFGDLVRLEPTVITFLVIPSIAAAVCGRLENLVTVLIAGLTMGVIENMMTLSPELKGFRTIAPFVIAAVVLIWNTRGVRLTFGTRD